MKSSDIYKQSASKRNSFANYDHEKHIAASRKGGIASGNSRRQKRELIRQERIHDEAMRIQMTENVATIRTSARMLIEAKRISGRK